MAESAAAAPSAVPTFAVKAGLAQMLKGGVIMGACGCLSGTLSFVRRGGMWAAVLAAAPPRRCCTPPGKSPSADVTNVEEARIAEACGAVAVMALERVPVRALHVRSPCLSTCH